MLEIPAVHVVEWVEVLIVAGDDAHGANAVDPGAEYDDVADLHLTGKATDEAALEALVLFTRLPWPRIPGPDEPHAVGEEHVRVGTVGGPC